MVLNGSMPLQEGISTKYTITINCTDMFISHTSLTLKFAPENIFAARNRNILPIL